MGLNAMQERFCLEYAADARSNATRAAIVAGYSEKTAYSQASRLLKSVEVKARVRELRQQALLESGFDKESLRVAVMRELTRIGFSDVTDVVQISPAKQDSKCDDEVLSANKDSNRNEVLSAKEDSNRNEVLSALAAQNGGQRMLDFGHTLVSPTPCLSQDVTAAIKGIKLNTGKDGIVVGIEVDMYDKLQALKLLAEVAGVTKGDAVEVTVNVGDELENARRRARGVMTEADSEAGGADG